MPSKARKLFRDKLLPDVVSLDETHRKVNPDGHGRRALGHITRSGVVMLCAAWELYMEEVLVEGAEFLVDGASDPDFLPDPVKGRISQVAKNDKHDFGALRLCGFGWKDVYVDSVKKDAEKLNTPKYGNINELFSKWLAIDDISANWRHDRDVLNEFVRTRGEISHRGAGADYVRISRLREYKKIIDELVVDTDRFLSDHLKEIAFHNKRPWQR